MTDRVDEKVEKVVLKYVVGSVTDVLAIRFLREFVGKPVLAPFVRKRGDRTELTGLSAVQLLEV